MYLPLKASSRCNALTKGSIKEDTTRYTFNVTVTINPTGWDKKIQIDIGNDPFYTLLISEVSGKKLALKAAEYDGASISGTFDINMNQDTGVLVFESVSTRNPGHDRLRMEGTMNSSWNFTSVSNVEGIRIVCSSANGCDGGSGSYSGATVKGALNALAYEAIAVSGATCSFGNTGCTATTGTDCSAGSGCINYGVLTSANTFAADASFSTDMDNLTSGPICISAVDNSTAPTRSTISNCTL
jgi:hypothetical protein